ncbi:hypothetical protein LCGC14_0704590 [marine sediment metagenome]|uniref:Uncharacterized protein n=1 Tax=marine sediment metagenome TaxID=412755 RepID=A0A0F9R2B7_9ZZZZ
MPKPITAVTKVEPQLTPATIEGQPAKGLEHFSSEDLIIPYMVIMQKLSPQLEDSDLEEGQLVNSITLAPYDLPVLFIPIQLTKQRRLWKDRAEGGGMQCASIGKGSGLVPDVGDCIAEICVKCPKNQWTDGNPPECTFYRSYPSLVLGAEDLEKLIVISFPETNKFTGGAGKRLANMARGSTGDIFSRMYTLNCTQKQNSKGQKFYALSVDKPSKIHEDDYKQALSYFDMLKSMNVSYHEEGVKDTAEESGDEETPF